MGKNRSACELSILGYNVLWIVIVKVAQIDHKRSSYRKLSTFTIYRSADIFPKLQTNVSNDRNKKSFYEKESYIFIALPINSFGFLFSR